MFVVDSKSSWLVPYVVLWGSTDPGSAHDASCFKSFGEISQHLFFQSCTWSALAWLFGLFALLALLAFAALFTLFALLGFTAFFRFFWFIWFAAFAWFSWFAALWLKANLNWWHFWGTIFPNRLNPFGWRGFPSNWRGSPSSWRSFPFLNWLNTFLPWIALFNWHFNTFLWRFFTFWNGFIAWKNATSVFKNVSEVTAGTFSSHWTPIFALIANWFTASIRCHPESERAAFASTIGPVLMAIRFHKCTDSACISSDNHQNKTDEKFLIEYWLFFHGFGKFLWMVFRLERIYSWLET